MQTLVGGGGCGAKRADARTEGRLAVGVARGDGLHEPVLKAVCGMGGGGGGRRVGECVVQGCVCVVQEARANCP